MSYSREEYRLIKLGLLPKTTGPKPKKPLRRVSPKKLAEQAEAKKAGTDGKMDFWFEAQRKKLKGKCLFCNSGTTWKNEELWRIAIAHLMPKARFKSVATCDENWVELCWDCHTSFDEGKISWEMIFDSKEIDIIHPKLKEVLQSISKEEQKYKLYSRLTALLNEKKKL